MEEQNYRVDGAPEGKAKENSAPSSDGDESNREGEIEQFEEQRRVSVDRTDDCVVESSSIGEQKTTGSENLASVQMSKGDLQVDFDESSHHLSDVPVEYSLQCLQSGSRLKAGLTGQSAQVQVQLLDDPSKLELSPTLVSSGQSKSSLSSRNPSEQTPQPIAKENTVCSKRQTLQKAPSDGYNWRKYGQKQVKSPEGTRSYYRCTFSNCVAKKIECCDIAHCLIETVYRSHHNHDPPQKVNCARSSLPSSPHSRSNNTNYLVRVGNDQFPSTASIKPLVRINEVQQECRGSDEITELNMEDVDGPECQEREERKSTETLPMPRKKPKYIVHAAGDIGISGDGYRWRKYGQKMVKNNPHPRNYYKCTSAGCPVRKHIEQAVDNSSAVIITYKEVHNHDTPVPRKRHISNNVLTTSPISSDQKTKQQESEMQWSVDKEGKLMGETLNACGDKASESAKRLLSVGFEIKPC